MSASLQSFHKLHNLDHHKTDKASMDKKVQLQITLYKGRLSIETSHSLYSSALELIL